MSRKSRNDNESLRRQIACLEQQCKEQETIIKEERGLNIDLWERLQKTLKKLQEAEESMFELDKDWQRLKAQEQLRDSHPTKNSSHTQTQGIDLSVSPTHIESIPPIPRPASELSSGIDLSVSPTHIESIPPPLQFRPIFIEQVRSISVPANEPASAADESPSPKPPVAEPPPQVHTISAISISTTDTEPASDDQSVPVSSTDPVSSPQPPPPSKTASPIVSQTQTCHSPKYQPPHKRKNFRSRKYSTYGLLHGPSKKQGNFHSKPQPTNFLTDNQGRRYHYTPQRLVKPQNTRVGADGLGDLVTAISYSVLRWLAPC